jgi:hypothetical protein
MLLLLAGLRAAELLGVDTFALSGRKYLGGGSDEHGRRVRRYHDFAAKLIAECKTDLNTVYVESLLPSYVDKGLKKKHKRGLYD